MGDALKQELEALITSQLQALRAELSIPVPPSPAEETGRARTSRGVLQTWYTKLTGDPPPTSSTECAIGSPTELRHFPGNPVPRPEGIKDIGIQFDITRTSYGQSLNGLAKGFFAEVKRWAPAVSFLFDSVCSLLGILAAPDTPDTVLNATSGVTLSLVEVLNQAVRSLRVHEFRASHGAHFAEAVDSHLVLRGQQATYAPDDINALEQALLQSQTSTVAKEAAKARAQAVLGQDQPKGSRRGKGNKGRPRSSSNQFRASDPSPSAPAPDA
ncbi:MAG: hypothetical protein Rubg2KO_41350 [Rubricoccaceae bacterium]